MVLSNVVSLFGHLIGRLGFGEKFFVYLDIAFFFFGYVIDVPDGVDRTNSFTQCTGYALFRIDVEHLVTLVNAVDRANIDAGPVLDANTRRHDDERQLATLPDWFAFLPKSARTFIGVLRLKRRDQCGQAFELRLID